MNFIDGHCDTILRCYNDKISFMDGEMHLNNLKMDSANIVLQYFALFIESKYKPYCGLEQTLKLILFFKKNILAKIPNFVLVTSHKELQLLGKKKLALLAIEGAEALGDSLSILEVLFELGIRSIGLTWNQRNNIGNGCLDTNLGLSKFGIKVVRKMQEIGMIVDCAHLSEQGLIDVFETSDKPVIISHANCYALYGHPRNISNQNLKLLAQNGGLIGITFVPDFLAPTNAKIDHIITHIIHAVEVAGIDHVALGSDFDGFEDMPVGMEGAQSLHKIVEMLIQKGFSKAEINKITFENHLRVITNNIPE